ncbi:MAG: periplasmic heavy metal sensor [Verrucomicrobiota bacterium]
MKRGALVLLLALVLSASTYCIYFWCATRTAEAMLSKPEGDYEWLRREFVLNDVEFAKITQLHEEYRPRCDAMCRRIAEANAKANALVASGHEVTPEIQAALNECAAAQQDCRRQMLQHVYAVSALMSPAHGDRYLKMMTSRIVEPGLPHDSVVSQGPR